MSITGEQALAPFSAATERLLEDKDFLNDIDGFKSKLLSRISELRKEILALQHRQNDLPLPNQLPLELLSKIFLFHARSSRIEGRKLVSPFLLLGI